jgi:tetratricopeptide (TPR) repeat protein
LEKQWKLLIHFVFGLFATRCAAASLPFRREALEPLPVRLRTQPVFRDALHALAALALKSTGGEWGPPPGKEVPMKSWAVALISVLVAACASVPMPSRVGALFNDRLFAPPSVRISADDVFKLSPEMERFLNVEIASDLWTKGAREGLVGAIYREGQLKIEYDSAMTRNAAQAFAARSGNCLSLVIMTAAFAKALQLPVTFQSIPAEETVSRTEGMLFYIGHVNLTLGSGRAFVGLRSTTPDLLTVDFLPAQQLSGMRPRPIPENTVVAMYMNNRAAEMFALGQVNDAYWWARAAVEADPLFVSAYNTLGVVYRRHGNLVEAQRVLAYAMERDPKNTRVMSNQISVLNDLGRVAEARDLSRRLEQMDPNPIFSYFESGRKAMRDGDYQIARDLFAKEVSRAPYYHEFHYWLANAYFALGDVERAQRELALALEYSTTRRDHDVYASKLDRLKAHRIQ